MPVVKCRRCGAVATAQIGPEAIETSYGLSFRENCRDLADRGGADFVSTISACPSMDSALKRLTARVARQQRRRAAVAPAATPKPPEDTEPSLKKALMDSSALVRA